MKINKFKKMPKGRYKVTFDSNEELVLYEDVIFKYELLLKKDITLKKLEEILEDNRYYESYNMALSYIEYKLRSKKEIEDYLRRKEINETIIKRVIDDLEKKGYLNDLNYTKAFILDKINFTNHGPYKIKRELINNGIDENIIDNELSKIEDNVFKDKIKKIIEKRKKANNKSINIFKMKVIEYLISLGYDKEDILENLNIDEQFILNDSIKIVKDKEKLMEKYKKKYEGSKLDFQVKSALYRKGYSSEEINRLFDE